MAQLKLWKTFSVLMVLMLIASLGAALVPTAPVKADGGAHTLNVAQWTGPTQLANVSGRSTVIKVGDTYHMWYSSDEEKLSHTSSTDPASFATGAENSFTDEAPVEVGSVTVYSERGTFYMIAYGSSNKVFNIYTSSDGVAWSNKGIVFSGLGLTDYNKIDGPYLFKDGAKYRLYFQVKTPETSPTYYDIYTAEARGSLAAIADGNDDSDFVLANGNKPVLSPSNVSTHWDGQWVMHPCVVKDNDKYYMWYSAHNSPSGSSPQQIGFASSTDGYNWVKSPGNPVISRTTYGALGEPSVIKDGDTWRIWYLASSDRAIKYCTATGPFEFSSIQAAVSAASSGDTINVAAGTYNTATGETFPIAINKDNLTIKGAQFGVDPTAEGARTDEAQETVIDSAGTGSGVIVFNITASGVTIDGFTVKNNTAGRAAIVIGNPDSEHKSITNENITISNNILTANKRGLCIYDNRDSLVKNNRIVNSTDIAIYMAAVESSTQITGNTITGNHVPNLSFGAISVSFGSTYPLTQPTITDNYISNNGICGINIYGASAIIRGNTVTGHSNTGIIFYYQPVGAPTAIVEDNSVTENGNDTGGDNQMAISGIALCQAAPIVRGNTVSGNSPCGIYLVNTHNPYGGDGNVDAVIENNTISKNIQDGIYFYNRYGSSPTITGNTITENGNDGILLDVPHNGPGDVCHPVIHFNHIKGNTRYGVENKEAAVTLDATNNWWGANSGPSGKGPGTGDAVSANVDYEPWLTTGLKKVESETITDSGVMKETATGGSVSITATGDHTITTAKYDGNPAGTPTFQATNYYDVHLDNATGVTKMEIQFKPATASTVIYYWTGSTWAPCSDQTYASGCMTVTVTATTKPNLTDLTGLVFASGTTPTPTATPTPTPTPTPTVSGISTMFPQTHGAGGVTTAVPQGPMALPNMLVQSAAITEGKQVSAKVANTGGASGSLRVTLYAGNNAVESKNVSLAPGDIATVSFDASSLGPGTYNIKVNNVPAGQLTVEGGSSPIFFIALGAYLILMAALIIIYFRKRRAMD